MTNQPANALTALRPDAKKPDRVFDDGDVALILKADGSINMLTSNIDPSRLAADPATWTEADHKAALAGSRIFALSFAAGHPVLMDMLMQIANDPEIVDFDKLAQSTRPH
ncbi:hypothetical protein [Ancylobacter rudongensis]|uniref:Uncharacterized protein n=1 Tax=Ancylobacter rudongensis TaxID=177413 RepID=A0A1G4UP50_9HYPH|nr:hypothetical protein [Ancylobacter rudongensis]SCW95412.1 hypothetical protein SAMN05660859_0021 [Ancylobacter rudongensis]